VKRSSLLLTIIILSWVSSSEAASIACNTYDDYSTRYTAVCNTETGVVEPIHIPTIRAVASDGTMYTANAELHWPSEDGGQCRFVQRISRLDGHPLVPDRLVWTTVYEEEYTYDKWLDGENLVCYVWGSVHGSVYFQDLEVRDIDGSGNHRLYVSNACGACETKRIYYINADGTGDKTLYYDLSSAPIGVASCEGRLSSYWAGDFNFDNDNNLYISSGNHVPAAIFRVSGAGLDEVTGVPEQIFEHTRSGIMDFVFENDNVFYFHGIRNPWIARGNLETGEYDLVFTNPSGSNIADLIRVIPEEGSEGGSAREPFSGAMRGSARIPGLSSPSSKMERRPPRRSDLLIKEIEIGTSIKPTNKTLVRLPVRITIKNSGKDMSGFIDVAVSIKTAGTKQEIPAVFSVAGQKGPYQGLDHGLSFEQEVAIAGFVEFSYPRQKIGKKSSIALLARVIGCPSKLKQRPQKCATDEEDRSNNIKMLPIDLSRMGKSR